MTTNFTTQLYLAVGASFQDYGDGKGYSLEVMDQDTKRMRGDRPYYFTNLKKGDGVQEIVEFIVKTGGWLGRLPAVFPCVG